MLFSSSSGAAELAAFSISDGSASGRRQQEFHFQAFTRLEFEPLSDLDESRLTVFHRQTYHYDLFRTVRSGREFWEHPNFTALPGPPTTATGSRSAPG